MARNRGKRTGQTSGQASQNTGSSSKTDVVETGAGEAPKRPDAAAAEASKSSQTSVPAASSSVSTKPDESKASAKPSANIGSVPSSKTADSKKPATVAASTSAPSANQPSGGSGFWPGLLGGLIGGAGMALAASVFWFGNQSNDAIMEVQSATAVLDDRLSVVEGEVGAVGSLAESAAQSDALSGRLADLEQEVTSLKDISASSEGVSGEAGANTDLGERLAVLEQDIATLQSTLPTLEATLSSTGISVEKNGQQAAALNGSVETLNQATVRLGTDLGSLSDRVGQAEDKLDFIGGEYQRAAAMIVAIGDIDRSVLRAEPFESALESFRTLGKDSPEVNDIISKLEPMAKEGVPTLSDLKQSFGEVSSRILLAEEDDGTLADQVSDNLFSIINMRPSGADVEGEDSRSVVARAQAKLSANDVEGVLSELGGLSGKALESAQAWMTAAEGRLSANEAVADLRRYAQGLLMTGS